MTKESERPRTDAESLLPHSCGSGPRKTLGVPAGHLPSGGPDPGAQGAEKSFPELPRETASLIAAALQEDVGSGDRTTEAVVPADRQVRAAVWAKEDGVLAGLAAAREVFRLLSAEIQFMPRVGEGDHFTAGGRLINLEGPARGILTGERTALNFLQRLSGVATVTARFVEAVAGTKTKILDTRKTTPGWRALERAAVRAGGGENHRSRLDEVILLKENHVRAGGGLECVLGALSAIEGSFMVILEAPDLPTVDRLLEFPRLGRILLDNLPPEHVAEAVERIRSARPELEIEVSGGVTLEIAPRLAAMGVDYLSIGSLTHSAPAIDLSLLVGE